VRSYLVFVAVALAAPLRAQDSTLAFPVSVKTFGAKCDGVTDDARAIQAAVDAITAAGGGVLLFPRGQCVLSRTITSYKAPIVFQGMGGAGTILRWTSDVHGFTVTAAGSVIRDLTIRGPGGDVNGAGFGINSGNATRVTVHDCIIEQWRGGGINTGGGGSLWVIARNTVRNNYQDGIYIADGTSHSTVSGNAVEENGANGIDINGSENLIVENTVTTSGLRHTLNTADTWGILIQAVDAQRVHADMNLIIHNVVYRNPNGPGIAIRGEGAFHANFNIVEGNHSYQNGQDGILVDGSATGAVEGTQVIGNVTNDNHRYGIAVTADKATPTRTRIANNIATGNSAGILLTSARETTVIDNALTGNTIAFQDDGSTQTVRAGNRLTSGSTALLTGRAKLSGGAVVVTTSEVQANDNVLLTNVSGGGTAGFLRVSAIASGRSFTITSSSGTDSGTIFWEIVH